MWGTGLRVRFGDVERERTPGHVRAAVAVARGLAEEEGEAPVEGAKGKWRGRRIFQINV